MNLELVRLTGEYREQLFEMLTEWKEDIIANHDFILPRQRPKHFCGSGEHPPPLK